MVGIQKIILRTLAVLGLAGVVVIIFLAYSIAVTFENWPWTRTQSFTSGSYLGLTIQSGKRQTFNKAIELQRKDVITVLELHDQEPTTYAKRYKGNPILVGDFERVSKSNRWFLRLVGCNCWLILKFEDDQLKNLIRYDYHGPTE